MDAGMATYPDQVAAPDTAAGVDQATIRAWIRDGSMDPIVAGSVMADQVSLNLQWRTVSGSEMSGVCNDMGSGELVSLPASGSVSMVGLVPGSQVIVRYQDSPALRRFAAPATALVLQTLSQRPATMTVETGSVRVCSP